jgi:hypothetical protein
VLPKEQSVLSTTETTTDVCTKDLGTMGDVGELIMLPIPLFFTKKRDGWSVNFKECQPLNCA